MVVSIVLFELLIDDLEPHLYNATAPSSICVRGAGIWLELASRCLGALSIDFPAFLPRPSTTRYSNWQLVNRKIIASVRYTPGP